METVDGEYQTFKAKNGAYVREHFFNTPELKELIADWTDDDLALNRGGHDIFQDLQRLQGRRRTQGQPTLILAKTIKGYGMGEAGEGMNISHQQKKLDTQRADPLPRPLQHAGADDQISKVPFLKFAEDSPRPVHARAPQALGGILMQRRARRRRWKSRRSRPSKRC